MHLWHCGAYRIDLATPRLMGIVNVTPDSFSDGGQFFDADAALAHARRLIDEGADILDIGGESTRPGAPEVGIDEELRRVLPLIEALREANVPLSIDTSKPQVMRAALAAGACIVNDVFALRLPGAVEAVAASDCGVVLMHMQGTPRTMQMAPHYADVVADVGLFLRGRSAVVQAAGVAIDRIVLDPGFGFGKTPAHNWSLLARLADLDVGGAPILAGLSRKSMLGQVTGRPVADRLSASVAAALVAVQRGAAIVRVHDVAATRDALAVWQTIKNNEGAS
ncbi:MAG: dihydropteroate synthase [Burkholderiaceae bacterium]|jgi:dihydropteroate synthase|nr:dihydropteroate synthase [Burkholderiaceae bacterium]